MKKELKDYYKVLGVKKTATKQEICKAYYILINRCTDIARMTCINEAYQVLRDDNKRFIYDLECDSRKEEKEYQEYLKRRAKRKKQETSFIGKVKKSYKEVREDEKQYPFYKRHEKITEQFNDEFDELNDTVPKKIVFHTLKGTAHVFGETIHQIKKLAYITEDTVPKFVIRNRKLIGTALLCTILATNIGTGKSEKQEPVNNQEIAIESETETENEFAEYVTDVTLDRKYELRGGDTLSKISIDSGASIPTIMRLNGIESQDRIYMGDTIIIPYYVSGDDIEYYTDITEVNYKSLNAIAEEYNTTTSTLYKLNKEAITIENDGTYKILSNTLIVPKFITKAELNQMKETKKEM